MMYRLTFSLFITLLAITAALAQLPHTVGILSYQPNETAEGYNFFYPHNQSDAFLMDNCGRLVHIWPGDPDYRPGNSAYLLANGNLVKTSRHFNGPAGHIWAGGGGESVEIRSWDNDLLWSFTLNDSTARLHHDIAPLPNGNILMIAWEEKLEAEVIQAGRDPALISQGKLWPDFILEVDPATDAIVWQWHVWDHLVQNFDSTKDNFGNVATNPTLVDINYAAETAHPDWMHGNAIAYNAELDQIVFSVPRFDEIWIIDHSTTTAEAAGHTGGLGGRGGDLLYRWGNPVAYRGGISTDQRLFFQHDIHWVEDFIDPSHPLYGQLIVFNNRVGPDSSTANIFDPGFDPVTWSYPMENGKWLPETYTKTIVHPIPIKMASDGVSSVQLLANDNYLICAGRQGYSFELNPEGEVVWEYLTPIHDNQPAVQYQSYDNLGNLTFRMNRYPPDFPAFADRDLSPIGYLEENPDTLFCDMVLPVVNREEELPVQLYPNPAQTWVSLTWEANEPLAVAVTDITGRPLVQLPAQYESTTLDTSNWPNGLYLVRVGNHTVRKLLIAR